MGILVGRGQLPASIGASQDNDFHASGSMGFAVIIGTGLTLTHEQFSENVIFVGRFGLINAVIRFWSARIDDAQFEST